MGKKTVAQLLVDTLDAAGVNEGSTGWPETHSMVLPIRYVHWMTSNGFR